VGIPCSTYQVVILRAALVMLNGVKHLPFRPLEGIAFTRSLERRSNLLHEHKDCFGINRLAEATPLTGEWG
jgi:hypothetical protein